MGHRSRRRTCSESHRLSLCSFLLLMAGPSSHDGTGLVLSTSRGTLPHQVRSLNTADLPCSHCSSERSTCRTPSSLMDNFCPLALVPRGRSLHSSRHMSASERNTLCSSCYSWPQRPLAPWRSRSRDGECFASSKFGSRSTSQSTR